MPDITKVYDAFLKILELEKIIETEIRKVSNAKRRKKFKKLCAKAIKKKDDKSLAAVRDHLFKL